MPQRIRLSRQKGWRKPEGAIVVARPSRWGNPARIGDFTLSWDRDRFGWPARHTRESAVDEFRVKHLLDLTFREEIRNVLRGHDLACWCPLDQPCHADVLLEFANA